MNIDLEQNIRKRAYELWERQGRVHGRHDEHWHAAKLELTGAARDASSIALPAPDIAVAAAVAAEKPRTSRRATPVEPPVPTAAPRRRRAPARPAQ